VQKFFSGLLHLILQTAQNGSNASAVVFLYRTEIKHGGIIKTALVEVLKEKRTNFFDQANKANVIRLENISLLVYGRPTYDPEVSLRIVGAQIASAECSKDGKSEISHLKEP
jgi:hypothetical protein